MLTKLTAPGHADEYVRAFAQLNVILESKPEQLVVPAICSGTIAANVSLTSINLHASAT